MYLFWEISKTGSPSLGVLHSGMKYGETNKRNWRSVHSCKVMILQRSQISETSAKVQNKEYLPTMEKDQVTEHLNELDMHKSLGFGFISDRMYL